MLGWAFSVVEPGLVSAAMATLPPRPSTAGCKQAPPTTHNQCPVSRNTRIYHTPGDIFSVNSDDDTRVVQIKFWCVHQSSLSPSIFNKDIQTREVFSHQRTSQVKTSKIPVPWRKLSGIKNSMTKTILINNNGDPSSSPPHKNSPCKPLRSQSIPHSKLRSRTTLVQLGHVHPPVVQRAEGHLPSPQVDPHSSNRTEKRTRKMDQQRNHQGTSQSITLECPNGGMESEPRTAQASMSHYA
jgi:hypothetical protein